jgi:hypothetical protein
MRVRGQKPFEQPGADDYEQRSSLCSECHINEQRSRMILNIVQKMMSEPRESVGGWLANGK